VCHELVKIDRPVLRIPSLAIHLDRSLSEGFKVNFQTHMVPIIATAVNAALGEAAGGVATATAPEAKKRKEDVSAKHHPMLLEMLAEELGCEPEDVLDFELQLCDVQPSVIGGARREFIFSGRLDNLTSCYASLRAIVTASSDESLAAETGVRMMVHYDHEEVGSDSAQGAGSSMTEDAMRRISAALGGGAIEGADERARRASFCVSADMAHAVHPNYSAGIQDPAQLS
jgi:aspartyl aminopeptidase